MWGAVQSAQKISDTVLAVPMRRLCLLLMMQVGWASAATIVSSSIMCSDPSDCQSTGAYTNAGAPSTTVYAQVITAANSGETNSAWVSVQEDLAITITSGPSTGYFLPCLDAFADSFGGYSSASIELGSYSAMNNGIGASGNCGAAPSHFQPYTLGVTQFLPLGIDVYATASGDGSSSPQAGASATIDSVQVFDSNVQFVPDATWTFSSAPDSTFSSTPEPGTGFYVLCGGLFLFVGRSRRSARIDGNSRR
jgi:hypothetical protein